VRAVHQPAIQKQLKYKSIYIYNFLFLLFNFFFSFSLSFNSDTATAYVQIKKRHTYLIHIILYLECLIFTFKVIVAEPQNLTMSGEWQHGLFGCFDNFTVCIISWLVPCYQFGKNAEAVGESCLMCGLGMIVPILNLILGAKIRGKIRDSKGIQGSFVGDLLLWFCCPLCALVQEGQEVGASPQALSMARE